ncbi:hypothetical protein MTR67_034616 [Solanum verrucosum]|uniref:Integrase zinc-binding domain-containing protein n=1 Tax=Solanum verrucosum TaxID=315347 RepID=A0AAF0U8T3_SOLVR|nr:hypothetical protein MTR67_034616 [Solanum verrucosum]
MYRDLRKVYWWKDMKRDIAGFVTKCPNVNKIRQSSHICFLIVVAAEGLFAESTGNQMATMPCTAKGHGWLRPAIGVVELS